MEAVKTHITVESDTIKIPELKKFMGKRIEIILIDDSQNERTCKGKFDKLKALQGKIDFDETALGELRDNSML